LTHTLHAETDGQTAVNALCSLGSRWEGRLINIQIASRFPLWADSRACTRSTERLTSDRPIVTDLGRIYQDSGPTRTTVENIGRSTSHGPPC